MKILKKLFITSIFLWALSLPSSITYAGQINLSTYYPSPFGSYNRLRFVPHDLSTLPITCDADMEGLIIYNDDPAVQKLYICQSDTTWGIVAGLWTQNGSNIFFNTGNVGIGTNTPAKLLTLDSGAYGVSSLRFEHMFDFFDFALDGTGSLRITNDSSDFWVFRQEGGFGVGVDPLTGGTSSGAFLRARQAPGRINPIIGLEQSDGTTVFVVDTNGNTGIRTATPTADLSFDGETDRIMWMERVSGGVGSNLTIQAGGSASGEGDRDGGSLILSGGISTGTGGSNIQFATATPLVSGGTADQIPDIKMTITGDGDVGIGTSTPSEKFEVTSGAIKATGGLIIETRTSDPSSPVDGQMWLRTDL